MKVVIAFMQSVLFPSTAMPDPSVISEYDLFNKNTPPFCGTISIVCNAADMFQYFQLQASY